MFSPNCKVPNSKKNRLIRKQEAEGLLEKLIKSL